MPTYDYTKKAKDCIVDEDARHSSRAPRMPFGHDPEKEAKKADYRDNLTLDEVAENDLEMAKYAVKNAKRYFFDSPVKAQAFIGRCVQMTLNHCGLMILEGMKAKLVQKKMDKQNIIVESRTRDPFGNGTFYKGNDVWRNGLYIFKKGELVAFVSVPMFEQPSPLAIIQKHRPFVITNAKIATKGFR